jgi:hypothetical protein
MLAFDLETTGLDPVTCSVTAACLFGGPDPAAPITKTFLFKGEDKALDLALREELMQMLDEAPILCAFNGVRFDIPFLQQAWGVEPARAQAWRVKTFDIFEASKLALNQTFGLDRLLAANGLESKTGTGMKAIVMAMEGRWDELGDYCMQDTRMTYIVSTLPVIILPLNTFRDERVVIDRAHPSLFKFISISQTNLN